MTSSRDVSEQIFKEINAMDERHKQEVGETPFDSLDSTMNRFYHKERLVSDFSSHLQNGETIVLDGRECSLKKEEMYEDRNKSELIVKNFKRHPIVLRQDQHDEGFVTVSLQTNSPYPIHDKIYQQNGEDVPKENPFAKDEIILPFSGYAPQAQGMTKHDLIYTCKLIGGKDKINSAVNLTIGRVRYEDLDKLIAVKSEEPVSKETFNSKKPSKPRPLAFDSSDLAQAISKVQHASTAETVIENNQRRNSPADSTTGYIFNMEQDAGTGQSSRSLKPITSLASFTGSEGHKEIEKK